jgi:hypothetical protein
VKHFFNLANNNDHETEHRDNTGSHLVGGYQKYPAALVVHVPKFVLRPNHNYAHQHHKLGKSSKQQHSSPDLTLKLLVKFELVGQKPRHMQQIARQHNHC